MLKPTTLCKGDIMAMDRAYIDYEKLEKMTLREVIYVTKMKKNLKYHWCPVKTRLYLIKLFIVNMLRT